MKFTKTLSLVLALLTLCALFCACGKSDVPNGFKSVSPDAAAFVLYVPKSWYDNSACGTASATYSSTDRSNVSMTAMLIDSEYATLEEYLVYADKSLKSAVPGYELIPAEKAESSSAVTSSAVDSSAVELTIKEAASDTKLGGITASSFRYKAAMDGKNYRFLQIVCLRGNNFYVFTYSAEDSVYDSHLDDVNQILGYIRFK